MNDKEIEEQINFVNFLCRNNMDIVNDILPYIQSEVFLDNLYPEKWPNQSDEHSNSRSTISNYDNILYIKEKE